MDIIDTSKLKKKHFVSKLDTKNDGVNYLKI